MRPSQLLALLGSLCACQGAAEQQSAEQQKAASEAVAIGAAADPVSAKIIERQLPDPIRVLSPKAGGDTIRISNGQKLRIIPGSKADFAGVSAEQYRENAEAAFIRQQASGRVRRIGNQLVLTLDNGKPIVFKDDTYLLRGDDNEDIDKYYQYQGNLPGLPYWAVHESLYEAFTTFLIHQQTGKQTAIKGEYDLSPDRTHLLVSYAGTVYEGDVHELTLYAINHQKIRLLWHRALNPWAPSRTRWLNDTTIAVEQLYPTANDPTSFDQLNYVRLILP